MSQPQSTYRFKELKAFPGYAIDTEGQPWSRRVSGSGSKLHSKWKKLRAFQRRNKPYLLVNLSVGGKRRTVFVHRLILETFVGPCPPGMECRHFPDRNPNNNRLANVSWGTKKQNSADRIVHGTDNRGEKNAGVKLNNQKVRDIRAAVAAGANITRLGHKYGVTRETIRHAVKRMTWKCVL